MAHVSFGSEYVFQSATTSYTSVAAIDATHFVVAYKKDVSNDGVAVIGEISGGVITYGTPNTFEEDGWDIDSLGVAVLDSTHFVVAYNRGGNGDARIGVVSGKTITSYGTRATFNPGNDAKEIATTALDSTHFVIAYHDWGGLRGRVIAGSVSGSTVSFGSEVATTGEYLGHHNTLATLDDTHFIVAYDSSARVGTVTGTSISLGTSSAFNTGGNSYNQITALDSTHFVIAYRDTGNSHYGTVRVGAVSGSTISSYGAESVFNSADTTNIGITSFNDNYFVVGYKDIGNSDYGTSCVGYVIGTSIDSYGRKGVFNSGSTDHIDVSLLTNPNFVVAYRDVANSHYGTSLCGKAIFFVPQINII